MTTFRERLLGRVVVDLKAPNTHDDAPCWEWQGTKIDAGYGQIKRGDRLVGTHRAAWELLISPIPEGLVIDHLCRNPACVNPAHLEPVTVAENTRRGCGPTALNMAKTHCPQGHQYSHVSSRGWRVCRICQNERNRKYMAARYRAMKERVQ